MPTSMATQYTKAGEINPGVEETTKKPKKQQSEWEKMFANVTPHDRLISKMLMERTVIIMLS